jgi:predicted phosphodiesterase
MESVMFNIKEFVCCAVSKLYIPPELATISEKKLLHISDTPTGFYPELKVLIDKLKPAYIVHTGDLTDNIKLGFNPGLIDEHEKGIKELASIFDASGAEIILALGNHDNFDIDRLYLYKSRIIKDAETIEIENRSFRISHLPEGIIKEPAQYNLFGHDLTLKYGLIDGNMYFNGISYINIIGLESGSHTLLCYPCGVNNARLGRGKVGL